MSRRKSDVISLFRSLNLYLLISVSLYMYIYIYINTIENKQKIVPAVVKWGMVNSGKCVFFNR